MDVLPLRSRVFHRKPRGLTGSVRQNFSLKLSRHSLSPLFFRNASISGEILHQHLSLKLWSHGQQQKRKLYPNVLCEFRSKSSSFGDKGGQGHGGERAHKARTSTSNNKYRDIRKKPFRFRARLRLATRNLCHLSPSAILRIILTYARANSKKVVLSTIFCFTLALGCLCLKHTTAAAPHVVPYSDLVHHLDSGMVTSALFEEGSRHVFFNLKNDILVEDNSGMHIHEAAASTSAFVNAKSLQTSSLKAVMDEDMAKQWDREADVRAAHLELSHPASKLEDQDDSLDSQPSTSPSSMKSPKNDDTATQGIVEVGMGRVSAGSAAAETLSSSVQTISSASEQLRKAQSSPWQYSTRRIENDEAYLLKLMRERGVAYSSAPPPMSAGLRTTLITIFSLWIPLAPLFWLMHRQFTGGSSSNNKRRLSSSVRFEDVAGVDEAKAELTEIVSYLRGSTNFKRLGAKLPKGVLLVGPPGTGKTLLARAVAGEAGLPFFAASASEFVEMFVGRGAARIRDLFGGARKCSPSIIFIDELDAVGGRRGRSFNDERDQTLNQLLTEMDGFESDTGVLVIAATNRPEALDPALCRPGRFSRKVFVREPDQQGREQILAVHMRGVPVEGDAKVVQSMVASITSGFVGADLASAVNEAAFLAARNGRAVVGLAEFKTAVMRVKFGVGNKPAFSGALGRVFDWLQPKATPSMPSGYEAPSWSG